MSTLRVALAQILSGADPQKNLELVASKTAEAAAHDAQLVIFPEATMSRFGLPLTVARTRWMLGLKRRFVILRDHCRL